MIAIKVRGKRKHANKIEATRQSGRWMEGKDEREANTWTGPSRWHRGRRGSVPSRRPSPMCLDAWQVPLHHRVHPFAECPSK